MLESDQAKYIEYMNSKFNEDLTSLRRLING